MTTKTGPVAGLALALVLILGSSEAQAGRYGVNQTINQSKSVDFCSFFPFSCNGYCSDLLEARCQQVAPSFCNSGDIFVSASFGGVYPSSSCSMTLGHPIVCEEGQVRHVGTVNCSGSCNALCEENEFYECSNPFDCFLLYGDPGFGTWECWFNQCILTNSPLVLHLPDYYSAGGGHQSWWKMGFCGAETPTVCLDWAGDGNVSCTAWLEPGSEVAFVVALSDADMLGLLGGASVLADPSRHFFGNVTMGPQGDHPYEHGFAALAAHCGQDPDADSEIDLTECGATLFAWDDRNGDGSIDIGELLDFQDLGITALGDVRTTGKKDKCGNTFRFESKATCSQGRCGTVLDVFFQPR